MEVKPLPIKEQQLVNLILKLNFPSNILFNCNSGCEYYVYWMKNL